MFLRIEICSEATIHAIRNCHSKFLKMTLVFLQKTQSRTNNLTGIIITPLLNFRSNEILEISSESYRCCFHISLIFHKVTNIW